MATFKIIARNVTTGRQIKKRVYTSEKDYLKYKDDLIKRYAWYADVECYELIVEEWKLIHSEPHFVNSPHFKP